MAGHDVSSNRTLHGLLDQWAALRPGDPPWSTFATLLDPRSQAR